ncbi:ferredoxin--NADP reductase [Gordonia sp. CPCC 205515]|uniref:2Fe-2S iron-sulfur cluster-binding protein n=1 Tax=Gordonia sp. CPCC 205515 TaxID=3140791 RepID=UPI003AF3387E
MTSELADAATLRRPADSAPGVRTVTVTSVIDETDDARSFVVQPDSDQAAEFVYRAGQFVTVRVPDHGRGTARCYSLSSSPHTDGEAQLKFTVKRVAGGTGSNWICDEVAPGHILEVLPPTGVFTPSSLDESVVLVAGGSGITPVISIAKSILHGGSGSVLLIYANRDEKSVIFGHELRRLSERFGSRLTVIHILESVQGYPAATQLADLIGPISTREVFVCGPTPLMDLVTSVCADLGMPRQRVRAERFLSLAGDPFNPIADEPTPGGDESADAAAVTVALDGERRSVPWRRSQRLLDALLDAGVDAPFSCREGACSACVCSLVSGEVRMVRNEVLTADDIADGYILTCQAEPVSDDLTIEY